MKNWKKINRKVLFVLSIILFVYVTQSNSQCISKGDIFQVIPPENRERLRERLASFLEYKKTGQWGKLYDLFYEKKMKKEAYIKLNNENPSDNQMIEFVPKTISQGFLNDNNAYLIEGCLTLKLKNKFIKENDIIVAHLVDKEWYFSNFGEVAPKDLCN